MALPRKKKRTEPRQRIAGKPALDEVAGDPQKATTKADESSAMVSSSASAWTGVVKWRSAFVVLGGASLDDESN